MSDYLSDEEQVVKLRDWWQDYGLFAVGAVVLSIVVFVGWRWYGGHTAERTAMLSDLYESYMAAEDIDERGALVERLDAEAPESAYRVLTLLGRASEAVTAGDIERARGYLTTATEASDDLLLSDMAHLQLAKLMMEPGGAGAEAALAELTKVRGSGFRSLAQETQGDIYQSLGRIDEAHMAYQAATDGLREGENRPILTMKLKDTAPPEDGKRAPAASVATTRSAPEPSDGAVVSSMAESGSEELTALKAKADAVKAAIGEKADEGSEKASEMASETASEVEEKASESLSEAMPAEGSLTGKLTEKVAEKVADKKGG